MYKMFFFVFLICFSSCLRSDCGLLLSNIVKILHPKAILGPAHLNACKVWPYSPDKILIVMTLVSEVPKQDADNATYDIDVAVVDRKSGLIISHRYDEGLIDDAIYVDQISIDTARYQLSPSIRAFGVRFFRRNNPTFNAYADEIINLYFLQNKTLKVPVKSLMMSKIHARWDEMTCSGVFESIQRTLLIEKGKRFDFNNLKINEITTRYKPEFIEDYGCFNSVENVKKRSMYMKYNGKKYKFIMGFL